MRQLVVVRQEPEKGEPSEPVRVFMVTNTNSTYKPLEVILSKPDEHAALLDRALNELVAFKNKYRILSELKDVFDVIDRITN